MASPGGAVVETSMVSLVEPLLDGDSGLKAQAAPCGRLEHDSVMGLGTAALTVKVKVAAWPRFTVALLMPGVIVRNTVLIVVTSLAVLLAGLTSPPPETVAVLVTLAGALAATFTVNVIAG